MSGEIQENGPSAENRQDIEEKTGPHRAVREEIGKGNQRRALRFQTCAGHQTSDILGFPSGRERQRETETGNTERHRNKYGGETVGGGGGG